MGVFHNHVELYHISFLIFYLFLFGFLFGILFVSELCEYIFSTQPARSKGEGEGTITTKKSTSTDDHLIVVRTAGS
jgi:hypothetical protein